MHQHLDSAAVCFEFMLQAQTDPEDMPIEDATVEWDEDDSPFVTVADININPQEFSSAVAMSHCERSSFNPWQGLEVHQPLGRINLVRRLVYEQMADFRNTKAN